VPTETLPLVGHSVPTGLYPSPALPILRLGESLWVALPGETWRRVVDHEARVQIRRAAWTARLRLLKHLSESSTIWEPFLAKADPPSAPSLMIRAKPLPHSARERRAHEGRFHPAQFGRLANSVHQLSTTVIGASGTPSRGWLMSKRCPSALTS
jgi:hypothetical protein